MAKNKNKNIKKMQDAEKTAIKLEEKLGEKLREMPAIKDKVDDMKETNKKLITSYSKSLEVVVDMSKLLQHYAKIVSMIEEMMRNIDSTFEFDDSDFSYIRQQTESTITNMKEQINKDMDNLMKIFDTKGLSSESQRIKKLYDGVNAVSESPEIGNSGTSNTNTVQSMPMPTPTPTPTPMSTQSPTQSQPMMGGKKNRRKLNKKQLENMNKLLKKLENKYKAY
jgi:hypothetical protein